MKIENWSSGAHAEAISLGALYIAQLKINLFWRSKYVSKLSLLSENWHQWVQKFIKLPITGLWLSFGCCWLKYCLEGEPIAMHQFFWTTCILIFLNCIWPFSPFLASLCLCVFTFRQDMTLIKSSYKQYHDQTKNRWKRLNLFCIEINNFLQFWPLFLFVCIHIWTSDVGIWHWLNQNNMVLGTILIP